MRFYCIVNNLSNETDRPTFVLLQKACKERLIEFIPIDAATLDFTDLPHLESGDILYRKGIQPEASMAEKLLMRQDLATIYTDDQTVAVHSRASAWDDVIRLLPLGFPVIKSVFCPVRALHNDNLLSKYVKELGGFPLVLKMSGQSHGTGVMRVDSYESLKSVLGFVSDVPGARDGLALRQYIHVKKHARLIVVGDEVVDSILYKPQAHDFRTNFGENISVEPHRFGDEVENVSARAVNSLGLAFSGVDVLIDQKGKPWIAEINCPCNFSRAQLATGVDTAGKLVDYLAAKASGIRAGA